MTSRAKQRDLLKRKPKLRQVMDSDWRWLWAAYQSGMWREDMAGNLTPRGFEEKMLDVIGGAKYDWVAEAPGDDGLRPVGLCLGRVLVEGADTEREHIEPFVEWFPWATPRNKVEATALFFKELSKQFKIFVFAPEGANDWWTRFVQYGLIRRGCKVIDYFSRGQHAMLFYTVSK